jgi:aminopeptidase N
MKTSNPQTIQLKDYREPDFFVSTVDLRFDLHEDHAQVHSRLMMRRNPKAGEAPLVLDGEKLELLGLKISGRELEAREFMVTEENLTIPKAPHGEFTVELSTRIKPQENLTLEGLYKSGGMFCTQCEAQGFRKITYYPDRPDVMAVFTTTIEADREKYPVLLSNGNLLERKDLGGGRHSAKWNDPFKKPSYLYALVAGDLGKVEDYFTTRSGRRVKLEIYVDKGNEDRTGHAMESLKKSMKWDEDTYGLEYDLDIFMIVAANDFNFGAMENKGLNIFNSSLVLAKPATATDGDYESIEGVVGHEYFHNWTGNRVTCRDWFQLSLKEGLTVYRDQEFSADMTSRAVCRVDNVNRLRIFQFAEDAGPMAHPIRPSSYIEINNFYTATVYEKGAEVIRMIATILGREGFRKGMDRYFELFDGLAVTTEDFVRAMEEANGVDLTQFRETWYEQAGTPELRVKTRYDESTGSYILEVAQSCAPTPGQAQKRPFHIPFAIGLIDRGTGKDLVNEVLHVKKEKETFTFRAPKAAVPSFLRGFSAPVKLHYEFAPGDLLFLLEKDGDSFSRWEAGQTLAMRELEGLIAAHAAGKELRASTEYLETLGRISEDDSLDPAFRAQLLTLPEEGYVGQQQATILVDSVHAARVFLAGEVARHNESRFAAVFAGLATDEPYRYEAGQVGRRSLRSTLLHYLASTGTGNFRGEALRLVREAGNMTEEIAGLGALIHHESREREEALDHFYRKWNQESLVMNKWLAMKGVSRLPGGLERVKRVMKDPVFNINNPNKVMSLLGSFGRGNLVQFHAKDGSAYRFFADLVLDIDTRNPSLAARLVGLFNQWKRFDIERQALMRAELERIVAQAKVSPGVFEIASKALK